MSNNRSLQASLVRSNSLTALAAGLLSLLLTFLGMRLWQRDLAVPFVYMGRRTVSQRSGKSPR